MSEKMEKLLEKELGKSMSEEDSCELELGLARTSPPEPTDPTYVECLEKELKIWRDKIDFIKKLQELLKAPT